MSQLMYQRSPKIIFTLVDEDVLALNRHGGRCYGMENVSAAVWQMLAEPVGIDSICHRLTEDYDVDPLDCRKDIERLMAELKIEGLVEEVPQV